MNRDELGAKAEAYLVPTSLLSDIVPAEDGPVIARAEGSLSFDTEGKSYLDFNSGQMCSTLGHNNPRIQKVIEQQSKVLTHASSVYYNVPQLELAERLASINDAPLRKSVFGELRFKLEQIGRAIGAPCRRPPFHRCADARFSWVEQLDASDQLLCIDCRLRTTNAGGIRYPDTLLLPLSLQE